jgi:hypothetical protein
LGSFPERREFFAAFIEDNWKLPRIPNSMDAIAGPITNMLDFSQKVDSDHRHELILDPSTGTVVDTD